MQPRPYFCRSVRAGFCFKAEAMKLLLCPLLLKRCGLALIMLLLLPAGGQAQTHQDISEEAENYLQHALQIIQKRALNRNKVNWPEISAQAFVLARGAQKPAQTYRAIRYALQSLGDHHSFLLLTTALRQSEKKLSNVATAENTKSLAATSPEKSISPFSQRYQPEGRLIESGKQRIGYLVVPRYWGPSNTDEARAFAQAIQDRIKLLHQQKPTGWILDLRGNMGGNMWPMLAGLGPLLEGEQVGLFQAEDGRTTWFYKDGRAGIRSSSGWQRVAVAVSRPVAVSDHKPMAVLIDHDTGSSGEAVAIACRGRADTRYFGRPTWGLSTANSGIPLADGAIIELTVSVDGDRTGQLYPDGLRPDLYLADLSGADDLKAATDWLSLWKGAK